MESADIVTPILAALDDGKARDVKVLDVRKMTSITDFMIIASGTSERHVSALSGQVVEKLKALGFMPIGVEGQTVGEWVLVDFGDAIVHVMKPQIREFYQLEKLWQGEYSSELAATG
jgi:ribosome-associated protein